ncbi:uncharacterized protein DS421_15g494840 [Arachis hypogaea]|nr:uncharacterized protein DS421_15g494840 [Arachis hypogaea]
MTHFMIIGRWQDRITNHQQVTEALDVEHSQLCATSISLLHLRRHTPLPFYLLFFFPYSCLVKLFLFF